MTIGRIALGLLMILQGIMLIQGGINEGLKQHKELRNLLNSHSDDLPLPMRLLKSLGLGQTSDRTLSMMVYVEAILMIVSGALLIANVRLGGLLLVLSMITLIITRDNPFLSVNDAQYRHNLQNMLKDLAVAGMGCLIFMKKFVIRHRRDPAAKAH